MATSTENTKSFLQWWLTRLGNRFFGIVEQYSITVYSVVDDTDYTVTLNDIEYTFNSGSSASETTILTGILALLTDFSGYITGTTLYISIENGEGFSISVGDNLSCSNVTGVTALESYRSNFDNPNEDAKPSYPFAAYSHKNLSSFLTETKYKAAGDVVKTHETHDIDINLYSNTDNDCVAWASFLNSSLKFPFVLSKLNDYGLGIAGEIENIIDVSAIVGGATEHRANFTLKIFSASQENLSTEESTESIESVEITNELNNNTFEVNKES